MMLINNKTNSPVKVGDEIITFRGDKAIVTGWASPHHGGSSGRIYVKIGEREQEFFPGVVNCDWINRGDRL